MRGRYSPPPSSKASKHDHPPPTRPNRPLPSRRTRIYILLATLLFLIYYISPTFPSLLIPHHHAPPHAPSLIHKNIDWSQYAYSQYATNSAYLCNAVMVFESLHRLGSRADRILLYPQEWDTDISDGNDRDSQLLVKARDWYKVKLIPVEIPKVVAAVVKKGGEDDDNKAAPQGRRGGGDGNEGEEGWEGGFTKFLNWREVQYARILHIDSDVTILKHMDELFLLPDTAVAMFRAYWLLSADDQQQQQQQRKLTSLLILLRPDETEYQRLMAAAINRGADQQQPNNDIYDMEILNRFYADSAMVLPHRQYGLLTGEFRRTAPADHGNYLGNGHERWNADLIFREASIVHFSDWPLPKPWIMWPHRLIGEIMPKCSRYGEGDGSTVEDCRDKEVWMGLYDDFRRRRKEVCALLSAPAPEWPPPPPPSRGNKTGTREGG